MALCTGSLCLWYLYTQEEIPANSRFFFFLPPRVGLRRDAPASSEPQVAFPQEGQRSTGLGWDGSLGRKRADAFPGRGLK